MPTLHDVTAETKQILRWGSIVIAAIILLVILFRVGISIKDRLFPKPIELPNAKFGKLPDIVFPKAKYAKQYRFVVDTVSGKLPVFFDKTKKVRDRIKIYKIGHNELTLLDLPTAKVHAERAGFTTGGLQVHDNLYRFTSPGDLPKNLEMDIVDRNFTISSDFLHNTLTVDAKNPPGETAAISSVTTLLTDLGTVTDDINSSKTKTKLLAIQNDKLINTEDIIDAKVIRVDLFQKDVDTLAIYYADINFTPMHFFVTSGKSFEPDIVAGNYYHQSILNDSGAYLLKPVSQAFAELSEGKGYVASDFTRELPIHIKDVLLGYFASGDYQEYLLPIYIFKGREDEFYAYVSALASQYVKVDATEPTAGTK